MRNNQEVKLTYFKESGKFYADGAYQTGYFLEYDVYKEVEAMRLNKDLPGLSNKSIAEFDILVTFGEGTLCVPALLKFKG